MTGRKIPMRTCVACRTTRPKRELVRVVRTVDGGVVIDGRGKVSGRGAYLCRSASCVDDALKTHKLERALERHLSEELVNALKGLDGQPG